MAGIYIANAVSYVCCWRGHITHQHRRAERLRRVAAELVSSLAEPEPILNPACFINCRASWGTRCFGGDPRIGVSCSRTPATAATATTRQAATSTLPNLAHEQMIRVECDEEDVKVPSQSPLARARLTTG